MSTITKITRMSFAGYKERLGQLRLELESKFPAIRIGTCTDDLELWLRTQHCTGSISLKITDIPERSMRADVSVGSGAALNGRLDEVQRGIDDYTVILQALRHAADALADVLVIG